ncbi:MAG: 50S ribosomal protein L30 [Pseudomonadota bacterium]
MPEEALEATEAKHGVKVTLRKSIIKSDQRQRAALRGLGLRKINQSRILEDTPSVRGNIKKVDHLVEVEETIG